LHLKVKSFSFVFVKFISFKSNLIPNSPGRTVNVLAKLANIFPFSYEFVLFMVLIEIIEVMTVLAAVTLLKIIYNFDFIHYLQGQVAVHSRYGLIVCKFAAFNV